MTNTTHDLRAMLPAVLKGSLREFRQMPGADLLGRIEAFYTWQNERRRENLWPYSRSTSQGPRPICTVADDAGRRLRGINFGSQDYLSLASHPSVADAARAAIERYGVHSAGSAAFMGNTTHSLALERELGEFLELEHVLLYPTGYAAGAGVIRGLVRANDHVVIDALAHACLQDGAAAATKNVYLSRHLEVGSVTRWLSHIRTKDRENAILVVTEGLFSMDSDTPDIKALAAVCREHGATLMVDVAHDFGCLGDGRGHIGLQDAMAHVDIVMGSFSKTFASNGGFVACRSRPVKEYLRYFSTPGTFSNALSPVQAAIVLEALRIVRSPEDLLGVEVQDVQSRGDGRAHRHRGSSRRIADVVVHDVDRIPGRAQRLHHPPTALAKPLPAADRTEDLDIDHRRRAEDRRAAEHAVTRVEATRERLRVEVEPCRAHVRRPALLVQHATRPEQLRHGRDEGLRVVDEPSQPRARKKLQQVRAAQGKHHDDDVEISSIVRARRRHRVQDNRPAAEQRHEPREGKRPDDIDCPRPAELLDVAGVDEAILHEDPPAGVDGERIGPLDPAIADAALEAVEEGREIPRIPLQDFEILARERREPRPLLDGIGADIPAPQLRRVLRLQLLPLVLARDMGDKGARVDVGILRADRGDPTPLADHPRGLGRPVLRLLQRRQIRSEHLPQIRGRQTVLVSTPPGLALGSARDGQHTALLRSRGRDADLLDIDVSRNIARQVKQEGVPPVADAIVREVATKPARRDVTEKDSSIEHVELQPASRPVGIPRPASDDPVAYMIDITQGVGGGQQSLLLASKSRCSTRQPPAYRAIVRWKHVIQTLHADRKCVQKRATTLRRRVDEKAPLRPQPPTRPKRVSQSSIPLARGLR